MVSANAVAPKKLYYAIMITDRAGGLYFGKILTYNNATSVKESPGFVVGRLKDGGYNPPPADQIVTISATQIPQDDKFCEFFG